MKAESFQLNFLSDYKDASCYEDVSVLLTKQVALLPGDVFFSIKPDLLYNFVNVLFSLPNCVFGIIQCL